MYVVSLARKPLSEPTVVGNVVEHGCAALAIEATRSANRWPANLILGTEDVIEELDTQSLAGGMHSAGHARHGVRDTSDPSGAKGMFPMHGKGAHRYGDGGGASRFFKQVKT